MNISERCYKMGEKLVYDAHIGGYYMIPNQPGLFNIETGERVPEAGNTVVDSMHQFTNFIREIELMLPGVLR